MHDDNEGDIRGGTAGYKHAGCTVLLSSFYKIAPRDGANLVSQLFSSYKNNYVQEVCYFLNSK